MTRDTLAATWDSGTSDELARRCGVPRVELLAETDSTQDVAHALAEGEAPTGTVVLADAQRAGRGRLGRDWSSEPGLGVWCTVLERPAADALDVLSLRVGLHCAEALDPFSTATVGVKWPNDLVQQIPRRSAPQDDAVIPSAASGYPRQQLLVFSKLGGILVEARWSGSSLAWVAVGVGINVVAPPGVPDAVGLAHNVRRTNVLEAIVRAVRSAAAASGQLDDAELARYRARDVLAGRRIVQPVAGTVEGISAAGALVVTTRRGATQVRTGTVVLEEKERV